MILSHFSASAFDKNVKRVDFRIRVIEGLALLSRPFQDRPSPVFPTYLKDEVNGAVNQGYMTIEI